MSHLEIEKVYQEWKSVKKWRDIFLRHSNKIPLESDLNTMPSYLVTGASRGLGVRHSATL